jgi:hypothetical protein
MSKNESEIIHTRKKPTLSWQQRRLLDIHKLTPEFAHPIVEGLHNIELIPEGKPAIFVSTHRTESDMGLAIRTIGEHVPLIITDISTHDSFKGDVADKATYIARKILGGNGSFLPISFERNGDEKKPIAFNPADFTAMASAMGETGKNILIAAHNPKQEKATPGFGAAYLAMLTGAPLVPIASEPSANNHAAHVVIGEPFYLDSIDVEPFMSVMEKRKQGETLTPEDLIQFRDFTKILREQGKIVFERVDMTLPEAVQT